MIRSEKTENIFSSNCDVITIPVNCIGVMGAGLAKQLKERHLDVYYTYKHYCKTGELRIDQPVLTRDRLSPCVFLLFPTKDDYRNKSTMYVIQKNLIWLREQCNTVKEPSSALYGYSTIAIPPIGCGCGELDWGEVKEYIYQYLSDTPVEVDIYNPFYIPHKKESKLFMRRK